MGTFLFWIFLGSGIPMGASIALTSPANMSFFGDHERGWHWYESVPTCEDPAVDEGTPEPRASEKQNHRPKTPSDLIKAYREELENRLHAAWIYPTPQNIKAYQEMQKDMMDRSKVFSTVWLQTVFQNPELDHTLISPVNQQGRHLQIDLEKNRTFDAIKSLSQTWGLFFFFSNDCPYCHQFAPIVAKFSNTYQWEVIAIQVGDGGANRMDNQDDIAKFFPNVQSDNGLFQAWGIKVLPSLFAVNPKTQSTIPVAHGLTSLDEMENRIMTLLGDKG
jgi:conjugal transfer pilus assembly protein TraF